jgi:hypothetical protein
MILAANRNSRMLPSRSVVFVLVLTTFLASPWQNSAATQKSTAKENAAVEDISGMYSFLNSGEFLQINIESGVVSGYISRKGDLESDRGTSLDQFFDKASIQGHQVTFTTRVLHGEWFEFKGVVERGRARSKAEDGYYILRGTITEFTAGEGNDKNPAGHPHQVEFRWMAQSQDVEEKKRKSKW